MCVWCVLDEDLRTTLCDVWCFDVLGIIIRRGRSLPDSNAKDGSIIHAVAYGGVGVFFWMPMVLLFRELVSALVCTPFQLLWEYTRMTTFMSKCSSSVNTQDLCTKHMTIVLALPWRCGYLESWNRNTSVWWNFPWEKGMNVLRIIVWRWRGFCISASVHHEVVWSLIGFPRIILVSCFVFCVCLVMITT